MRESTQLGLRKLQQRHEASNLLPQQGRQQLDLHAPLERRFDQSSAGEHLLAEEGTISRDAHCIPKYMVF